MESSSVISPEDVMECLMNDGTIDAMRLKIINQLKANDELKNTTIKMAEQSKVLNTPGAEKQTKRELFDALRQELETSVLEKASKSVWELILDNNGLGKEISETVERVPVGGGYGAKNARNAQRECSASAWMLLLGLGVLHCCSSADIFRDLYGIFWFRLIGSTAKAHLINPESGLNGVISLYICSPRTSNRTELTHDQGCRFACTGGVPRSLSEVI
ncbi:hypothetical protein Acr_06g0009810 [Actinidia rufa]|uniref:Uncharacterized protein n=1 Tax=Actinidia rufa TaxID=165716 RepID=A0A7J0ERD4_9ERIC|nr:hypothetical protein Acr_06g0009810 [Actinidia rufa]